ncbi:hypothetical protein [Nostoc sp.]|uniref:hypothetical protein n=1 Tax=Nostoc sp. TaxID=1180 RepID=UPI002FF78E03
MGHWGLGNSVLDFGEAAREQGVSPMSDCTKPFAQRLPLGEGILDFGLTIA